VEKRVTQPRNVKIVLHAESAEAVLVLTMDNVDRIAIQKKTVRRTATPQTAKPVTPQRVHVERHVILVIVSITPTVQILAVCVSEVVASSQVVLSPVTIIPTAWVILMDARNASEINVFLVAVDHFVSTIQIAKVKAIVQFALEGSLEVGECAQLLVA